LIGVTKEFYKKIYTNIKHFKIYFDTRVYKYSF